jgi:hypothetical protein
MLLLRLLLPPHNKPKYHALLTREGLSANAIVAVEGIGLGALSSFSDLTEDNIPAMMKEL